MNVMVQYLVNHWDNFTFYLMKLYQLHRLCSVEWQDYFQTNGKVCGSGL